MSEQTRHLQVVVNSTDPSIQEKVKMSDNTGGSSGGPPMDTYSKTEIDSKLEVVQLRIDNKLDKVLGELGWLKWLTCGTFFLVLGVIATAAIKYLINVV